MKRLIITIAVLVGGYLALERLGQRWQAYLANDPYGPQLDKAAAREAIERMDADWSVAADRFAAGRFAESDRTFEVGEARAGAYVSRYGQRPFDDGKTLKAWMADHKAEWVRQLRERRARVNRALRDQADVESLARFRRRVNDPQFDQFYAEILAEVADRVRATGSAVVVELNRTATPRSRKIQWIASLRASSSAPYLVFATAAQAATLGDLPFVGLVRASSYDNLSRYEIVEEKGPDQRYFDGRDNVPVGMLERIDFLLEPDSYAQRNLGLRLRSCSSITIKLPDYVDLGTRAPDEFIAAHREKITVTLDRAIAELPGMSLRSNPAYGFCALQPRSVMAGGVMPSATEDSRAIETYTFLE